MKYIPIDELKFTAKFGFLSRKIWETWFSKRSRTRNIRVWRGFVEEGYFKRHHDDRYKDVLHLATEGKKILQQAGIESVSPANIYHLNHDEIVADLAMQIFGSGKINRYSTEAELKKKNIDWRKYSHEGASMKFPDLLIYGHDGKTVALEIEISRKSPERYRKVLNSYSTQTWAAQILFIANQEVIFDRLAKAMTKVHFPTWEKPISFSWLADCRRDVMMANIHMAGSKTSTLNELLSIPDPEKANAA